MVETLEDDGCLKRVEECKMESGQATVVRTLTKMCCNKEKAVQWFHFKEAATGNLLDFDNGRIKISARNGSRREQMWRIEDGRMLNKHEPSKVLGLKEGAITLVDTEDSGAMDISFEGGALFDAASGYQLAASSTGLVDLGHVVVKRQSEIVAGIAAATAACMLSSGGSVWTQSPSSPVTCDELDGWPAFQELTNIDADTQCWDGVQPSFRLYERDHKTTLASQENELLSIRTGIQKNQIGRLAIVIHGYNSDAQLGEWPDRMADLILQHDPRVGAVLTVDWEEGARFGNYDEAAANTR